MWIRKKAFSTLCQVARESVNTAQELSDTCKAASKQVEDLVALNCVLLGHLKSTPDYQVIIDQANEDAIRATEAREHAAFVESLLKMLCAPK
jgi:hypothetical protein